MLRYMKPKGETRRTSRRKHKDKNTENTRTQDAGHKTQDAGEDVETAQGGLDEDAGRYWPGT